MAMILKKEHPIYGLYKPNYCVRASSCFAAFIEPTSSFPPKSTIFSTTISVQGGVFLLITSVLPVFQEDYQP
jgi:hypothetical protein